MKEYEADQQKLILNNGGKPAVVQPDTSSRDTQLPGMELNSAQTTAEKDVQPVPSPAAQPNTHTAPQPVVVTSILKKQSRYSELPSQLETANQTAKLADQVHEMDNLKTKVRVPNESLAPLQ